ncbi:unnamed protein product [Cylicocyclus nassatus]|uniref:BPTI/Kunitz inhibitor domain-containing protein n=1 Tax=Cylicocyclus nassatus TaxID=53992 RepID=A0AA36M5S8_CYLNA|nr:unnamed protein product [Cylicocyclus nassatus]
MLAGAAIILIITYLTYRLPIEPDEKKNKINLCDMPLDRGDSECDAPASGLKWYYDKEMDECYEYFYEGCGGGQNTFADDRSCQMRCIPADEVKCGANTKPRGTCTREKQHCPIGTFCSLGPMGAGICCDKKNEEEWTKELKPTCENGTLLTRKEWYGAAPQLGRNCSHRFCPENYKCIQTKHLAHCCLEH